MSLLSCQITYLSREPFDDSVFLFEEVKVQTRWS